jgi:hypothetical protein
VERRRPRCSHAQASQGRVRKIAVIPCQVLLPPGSVLGQMPFPGAHPT